MPYTRSMARAAARASRRYAKKSGKAATRFFARKTMGVRGTSGINWRNMAKTILSNVGKSKILSGKRVAKKTSKKSTATHIGSGGSNWPIRLSGPSKRFPRTKRGRFVKVSGKFRAKVRKVIDGDNPDGFFKETHFGIIELDQTSNSKDYGIFDPAGGTSTLAYQQDKQWIFGRTSNGQFNFNHWTFEKLIDACEVLFFNKINNLVNAAGVIKQNNETRHSEWPYKFDALGTTKNVQGLLDCKFKVKNSYVNYTLRNNTTRHYKITLIKAQPKGLRQSPNQITSAIGPTYADNSFENLAIEDWFTAMNYENQGRNITVDQFQPIFPGGITRIGIAGTNQASTVGYTGTNLNGNDPNGLGTSPMMSPSWNAQWKCGYQTVILAPGATQTISCQGPKNVMFSPQAWAQNLNPDPVTGVGSTDQPYEKNFCRYKPKWSESHFFVITPEVLPHGQNEGAGIFSNVTTATSDDKFAIAVQMSRTYSIECPQMAGTIFNTLNVGTANQTALLNRKKAYYINTWVAGVPSAAVGEEPVIVEELQPSTDAVVH